MPQQVDVAVIIPESLNSFRWRFITIRKQLGNSEARTALRVHDRNVSDVARVQAGPPDLPRHLGSKFPRFDVNPVRGTLNAKHRSAIILPIIPSETTSTSMHK